MKRLPTVLLAGSPEISEGEIIEINPGSVQLTGLDGLRHILLELGRSRAGAIRKVAEQHKAEWNVLFPGTFSGAAPLSSMSSTCSERRLHAESEQVFRVIAAVGRAAVAAAEEGPLTLVLRRAAWLDLPTLRAVPHLAERIAVSGVPLRVVLAELDPGDAVPTGAGGEERLALRRRHLDALVERMGETPDPGAAAPSADMPPAVQPPQSRERQLLEALNGADAAEAAAAAAIGLMRSAFFSTDHDTGVLAAHRLLEVLEVLDRDPGIGTGRVRKLVEEMELGDDPGSIGLDAKAVFTTDSDAVAGADALRSLAHRYLGMIHVFVLDYPPAIRYLRTAAGHGPGIVRARARLLLALLLIKRIGTVQEGFDEADAGLAGLAGDTSPTAAVEAAWLHNVKALGHVRLRQADEALAEEKAAIRLIGKLGTTDATHLKVNLVSNVSVLKEYSRRPDTAIHVWRQFSRRSTDWGDTFFKHHSYREGGLLVAAGAVGEALPVLAESYRLAQSADDRFHSAHMALERGRLLLDTSPGAAAPAFAAAREHAAAVGDPYLLALAAIGAGLAAGETGAALHDEVAALASASTSYPEESRTVLDALSSGTDADLLACLPAPRTKLNRPFSVVRLALPELV